MKRVKKTYNWKTKFLLQEMVYNWVTQMVEYCELIPRLLPERESYAKVISATPDIVQLIAKIQQVFLYSFAKLFPNTN